MNSKMGVSEHRNLREMGDANYLMLPSEGDSRIKELTAMLSGPEYTAVSFKNAKELVRKVDTWKKSRQSGN